MAQTFNIEIKPFKCHREPCARACALWCCNYDAKQTCHWHQKGLYKQLWIPLWIEPRRGWILLSTNDWVWFGERGHGYFLCWLPWWNMACGHGRPDWRGGIPAASDGFPHTGLVLGSWFTPMAGEQELLQRPGSQRSRLGPRVAAERRDTTAIMSGGAALSVTSSGGAALSVTSSGGAALSVTSSGGAALSVTSSGAAVNWKLGILFEQKPLTDDNCGVKKMMHLHKSPDVVVSLCCYTQEYTLKIQKSTTNSWSANYVALALSA